MLLFGLVITLCMACGARGRPPKDPFGAVGGIVVDAGTGDPVGMASITLHTESGKTVGKAVSKTSGLYDLEKVTPGRYEIHAVFAGQPLRVRNVVIVAGRMNYIDLVFTLGSVEPLDVDYGDPRQAAITRFRPSSITAGTGLIEGTVSAFGTKERLVGVVVTATSNAMPAPQQVVSDDRGAYRFTELLPGAYTVSAYYAMGGRAQIEVQRNSIAVAAGDGVRVPLVIELSE
jgi:hypothetical protein